MNRKLVGVGLMVGMIFGMSACGGSGDLTSSFLNNTWVSSCESTGSSTYTLFCTTFSDTNTAVSRNKTFSTSTCTGTGTVTSTTGTYTLAGSSSATSGATNYNFTVTATGTTFYSILQKDGSNLKFGASSGSNTGTSEALRHQAFYTNAFTPGTCSF